MGGTPSLATTRPADSRNEPRPYQPTGPVMSERDRSGAANLAEFGLCDEIATILLFVSRLLSFMISSFLESRPVVR